jgi:hypothetical protein
MKNGFTGEKQKTQLDTLNEVWNTKTDEFKNVSLD